MPPLSATQETLPVTHLVGYSPTESSFLVTSSIAKGMDVMSQSGALSALDRKSLWSQRELCSHLGGRTLCSSQRERQGQSWRPTFPPGRKTWLWRGARVPCPKADAAWCEIVARRLACSVTCRLSGPSPVSRAAWGAEARAA